MAFNLRIWGSGIFQYRSKTFRSHRNTSSKTVNILQPILIQTTPRGQVEGRIRAGHIRKNMLVLWDRSDLIFGIDIKSLAETEGIQRKKDYAKTKYFRK